MKSIVLTLTTMFSLIPAVARSQFGSGIVYDPTQSAHAIERIKQGENIFTNSVQLADNAIATYNLAPQMAIAPGSLYQPFLSPSTYWMMLNQAANTYGNSRQWTNSVSTGTSLGYQQASIPRTGQISGYGNLSTAAQQQIAAQGATAADGCQTGPVRIRRGRSRFLETAYRLTLIRLLGTRTSHGNEFGERNLP
jgi:hypothetical protein